MEISPYMLTLLLLYSFIFGMAAGVFNDINRISRALLGERRGQRRFDKLYDIKLAFVGKLSEKKEGAFTKRLMPILIFFQDVLLFVFIGCGIVVLNYYLNKGQMRLYTITAVGAGFAIYYFTIGKLVMLVSEVIVYIIRAFFSIIFKILFFPAKALGKLVKKMFLFAKRKIALALEKSMMMRYNEKEEKRLYELSLRGFAPNIKTEGENYES